MWIGKDLARISRLDDHSRIHEHKLVADFTCETHLMGHHDHGHSSRRERLARVAAGPKLTYGNYRIDGRHMRRTEMYGFMRTNENRAATWADVEELRDRWSGKIVVKGVMAADDTRRAAQVGVDAVMVSNHGGRQFDAQPSTIRALPEVLAAAGDDMEVLAISWCVGVVFIWLGDSHDLVR